MVVAGYFFELPRVWMMVAPPLTCAARPGVGESGKGVSTHGRSRVTHLRCELARCDAHEQRVLLHDVAREAQEVPVPLEEAWGL